MVVENDELLLRVWSLEDSAEAFKFYGDPEVSKFIGNGQPARDILQVERNLQLFIDHQKEHGFSPWAILDKKNNAHL